MPRERELTKAEKELKRYLTNQIDPRAIPNPSGDFVLTTGTKSEDARKLLNLYADLLKVSQEGYPYNIKLTIPDMIERPLISLEIDLKEAVKDGLLEKLQEFHSKRAKQEL